LSVLPGRWVRVAGLAFVLAGFSFSLTQIYANRLTPTRSHHEGVSRTDDLHAMADTIRRHALPGDRILHLRYESLAQLRWYLPELPQVVVDMGELAVRELDSKAIPSAQRLAGFEPVEIESAVSGVARVWVVATELVPGVMGLHEGLLDWLQARGQETAARQFGGRYAFSRVLLFALGKTPDRARPSDSFLYAREDGMPEDEYWVPDEVDVRWVKDEASGCRVTLAARGPSGADLLYDVISADAVVNAPTLDRAAAGNSRWRLQEYRDRQRSYMAYHTRVDGSSKADDVLRGSFDLPAGRYTVFVQRLAAGPEFAVPTANLRLCLGERTFDVSGEAAGGRGGWTWCRAGDWHHSGDGHVKLTIEATDPAKRPEALATFSRVVLRRSDAAAGSEAPEWLRGALHIPAGGTNTLTLPDDMPATQADLTVSGTTGSARVSMRRDAGGTLIAEPAVEPLPAEASDGRANVLLVLLDTLRADCLDDSRPDMPMPKLSRLATESWRFDNAMAQATWTKPSMASLFTSLYPGVHRVQFGTGSLLPDAEYREVDALPSAFETWAEYLRQAGYRTAAVQTNANVQAGLGFEQGFDSYVNAYDAYARASRVTDTALAQLSAPGPPFFLYAHYMDAHRPYAPPPQYLAHYNDLLAALSNDQRQAVFRLQREADPDPETEAALSEDGRRCLRALYDAGAGYLDDEASRLIEQVRLRFPNTFVIIAADHGEEFWEHGQLGHGSTVYQEVAHVPLLMSLPGKAPRRIREPVELIDVLPTVADALGLPASPAWQGRSLLAEIPSRPVYTQTRSSSRTRKLHWEAVMDGRRKLVADIGGGDARCYDLLSDPAERNGIREGEEPERLGRLLSEHRARYEQHPLCKVPAETRRISPEAAEALNALGYM
jgi:arylsulfatase A-like enzyme